MSRPNKISKGIVVPVTDAEWAEIQARQAAANSLFAVKDRKKKAVNAIRDAKLSEGYTHDFGGSVGVKTLETRTETDRTNWLGAGQIYLAQISAGNGAVEGAKIRSSDNTNITLSFDDAYAVILAMGQHTGAILNRSWVLKDAIDAASDHAAVTAIDITTGWPG